MTSGRVAMVVLGGEKKSGFGSVDRSIMGADEGGIADDHPELNVKSNNWNRGIGVDTSLESNTLDGLNNQPSPSSEKQRQVDEESFLQKGDGPILRPHSDRKDDGEGVQETAPGKANVVNGGGRELDGRNGENDGKGFKKDVDDLDERFSRLNPMAEEFLPPVFVNHHRSGGVNGGSSADVVYSNNLGSNHSVSSDENGTVKGNINSGGTKKRRNYGQVKRMNNRTSMAQREERIRRTVYVSDIDQQITEEHLALLFINCGHVVDCRICGDPNSVLRFAFIEFTDEEGARAALGLAGTVLGYYPVSVLPSKTAIAPVNPTFLPQSEDEREMCAKTIYCTNIDRKVTQDGIKLFFESVCGEVYQLRLLGDYNHPTRIAFVEFMLAESAIMALNCSGVVLGTLPIRISPSKTPVRPRAPCQPMH